MGWHHSDSTKVMDSRKLKSREFSLSVRQLLSRMSSSPSRVVAYLPSLQTILTRLRATSSTPSSLGSTLFPSHTLTPSQPSATIAQTKSTVPNDALHCPTTLVQSQLHPQFPLPGGVSLPTLTTPTPLSDQDSEEEIAASFLAVVREKPQGTVEMLIQECPMSLVKGFVKLFPGVEAKGLTVITLCEKTKNDMTGWSHEVESERDLLLEHFIDSAKEICARLTGAGSWADFIDPASGRAFFSPFSHDTLFETDERFRYLGFEIDDLGCCKCIHHPIWGAYAFVGTIFTDASSSSPILRSIMEL